MVEPVKTSCSVCGMGLRQIGICPACGHNQTVFENHEGDISKIDFDLPYGIDYAPNDKKIIRIPYGINHAP